MCKIYVSPITAKVPGEIHETLYEEGVLDHSVLYRLEALKTFWPAL